jgi:hypothetical protein
MALSAMTLWFWNLLLLPKSIAPLGLACFGPSKKIQGAQESFHTSSRMFENTTIITLSLFSQLPTTRPSQLIMHQQTQTTQEETIVQKGETQWKHTSGTPEDPRRKWLWYRAKCRARKQQWTCDRLNKKSTCTLTFFSHSHRRAFPLQQ